MGSDMGYFFGHWIVCHWNDLEDGSFMANMDNTKGVCVLVGVDYFLARGLTRGRVLACPDRGCSCAVLDGLLVSRNVNGRVWSNLGLLLVIDGGHLDVGWCSCLSSAMVVAMASYVSSARSLEGGFCEIYSPIMIRTSLRCNFKLRLRI